MLKPPSDIEPSDLFRKLLELPRPSEVIDFPRKGPDGKPLDQIRVCVLSHDEHDKAREKAFQFFKSKNYSADDLKQVAMREVVGDRIAKELIAMACFTVRSQIEDPTTGQPIYGRIFFDAADVGKLHTQEVEVLFDAYRLIQDKYGPREHDTDVDAWVEKLTEGGQSFPLLSLDLPELANLTSSLAARISTISHALESQWSELPSTCQSVLERFRLGTGSYSSQLESSERATTESFDIETTDALELGKKQRALMRIRDSLDLEHTTD